MNAEIQKWKKCHVFKLKDNSSVKENSVVEGTNCACGDHEYFNIQFTENHFEIVKEVGMQTLMLC